MTKIVNTPGTKPTQNVVDIIEEVDTYLLGKGYRMATAYGSTTWTDHDNRRCGDLMVSRISGATMVATGKPVTPAQEKEMGDLAMDYVWKHRERFGLSWQIWRGRIRRRITSNKWLRPVNIWAPYFKPRTHFDHGHFETNGQAVKPLAPKITGPAGSVPQPRTRIVYLDKLRRGQLDSDSVWWVQAALNKLGHAGRAALVLSGNYDDRTVSAARTFQLSLGDTFADGILGPLQTARLFEDAGWNITIEMES